VKLPHEAEQSQVTLHGLHTVLRGKSMHFHVQHDTRGNTVYVVSYW